MKLFFSFDRTVDTIFRNSRRNRIVKTCFLSKLKINLFLIISIDNNYQIIKKIIIILHITIQKLSTFSIIHFANQLLG